MLNLQEPAMIPVFIPHYLKYAGLNQYIRDISSTVIPIVCRGLATRLHTHKLEQRDIRYIIITNILDFRNKELLMVVGVGFYVQ
jgi:hypothetical protein